MTQALSNTLLGIAPDDAFALDFRVQVGDLSPAHHVSNVSFLRYLDEARSLYFGTAIGTARYYGGLLEVLGEVAIAVVVRNEIEYRSEVLPADGPITLRLWIPYVGRSSLVLAAEGYAAGAVEPCPVFESTVVLVERSTGRPWVMDESTRQVLEAQAGPRPPFRARAGLKSVA